MTAVLNVKHASEIILIKLGMRRLSVVYKEGIKRAERVFAALDVGIVAREHIEVGVGVLDQCANVFKRECGKTHLLSYLLRRFSGHGSQLRLGTFERVDGVVENIQERGHLSLIHI